MKTILITGSVLVALYLISQNQANGAFSTAPTAIPPATVSTSLALASVNTPGACAAIEGEAGLADAPPAGNDFLLNPAIQTRNNLRYAPAWLRTY